MPSIVRQFNIIIIIMNEGLPKYGSVDLKRRVNSHNKLPRLASIEVNNHKLKESTTTGKNDTGIKLSMMG